MTAKEYFDKYDVALYHNGDVDPRICYDIFRSMASEMMQVAQNSKKSGDKSFLKLVKTYNDKWNDLVKLFQKAHDGKSILKADGFSVMIHHIIKNDRKAEE